MQRYEIINEQIKEKFQQYKKDHPQRLEKRLKLGWNSCLFGFEEMERSLERLARYNVPYVEIGGHWGGDYEHYDAAELNRLFAAYGVRCSGVCGLFYNGNTLSSPDRFIRNRAKEYIAHELDLCQAIGATYLLVVPGTTGQYTAFDTCDFERSAKALGDMAEVFEKKGVKCALETVNAMETQMVNTIDETIAYIQEIGRPGFGHINGDVYHMQLEERHIGEAILKAGDLLVNLHMADSNRKPIGQGSLDLDTVIRALYLIGYNEGERFVTAEPIGLGRRMSHLLSAKHDPKWLDERVRDSTLYFREREEAVLAEA